jgi:transcriptional regulator with XRE-family HTH domain
MFQRRRLRTELRKARESANLTQKEVAPAMDWSLSKLIRIETGAVTISINDLKVLLQLYQVNDGKRVQSLVDMARAAREPAWWSAYRESTTPEFLAFLGYESSAAIIRNFEPMLVPGLLQTEEYARATIAETLPPVAQPEATVMTQVDQLVELRMERQDRISQRAERPKLFFALDEAVIHRWVGGPEVMRRQLRRLKEALVDPTLTIWIVPFSAGLYQRQRSAYLLFEFPAEEDDDVLYLEAARGELVIKDDLQESAIYLEAFWRIEQVALKNESAVELIDRALSRLAAGDGPPTPTHDEKVSRRRAPESDSASS